MRTFFVLARSLAIIVEQDYFSFPQYEIYFNYNSTSALEFKHTGTITVGDVTCLFPTQNPLQLESQPKTLPSIKEAARRLESMACLYRIIDGQYWAYRFCYGQEILQFHPVDANSLVTGDQYSLGTARKMSSSMVKEKKLDGHHQVYLEQVWEGGSVCDLHGKQRSTVIEYYCGPVELLKNYMETASCTYKMVVHTPRLCPLFAPLNKIVELPKIVCTLTDAKYEYLNDISSSFYQLSQVVDLATARKKPATETIVSQINSLYGDSPVVAEILGKLLAKHHDTGDIRVHKIIVKPEVKVRTADEDEPKNSDDDN